MSFKIVQTREPGAKGPLLSIVPTAWEKDGTLYWPPAKKKALLIKLIKDANSRPEPDWIPQPCSRKRQTFLSYEAAEELTAMEEQSDSESYQNLDCSKRMSSFKRAPNSDEELLSKKRTTNKNRTEAGRIPQADFNLIAEECQKATELLFGKENTKPAEKEINVQKQLNYLHNPIKENLNNSPVQPKVQQCTVVSENNGYGPKINIQSNIMVAEPRNKTPLVFENHTATTSNLNLLTSQDYEENGEFTYEVVAQNKSDDQIMQLTLNNQNTILQNQNLLLENQMKIMEQLANQQTIMELICQQLSNTKIAASTRVDLDLAPESVDLSDPLPISSVVKLEEFEMDLREESYMNKMIKLKSHICGTSGKLNGLNCSYRLIDSFFKRELLVHFSWSGGRRNEKGKLAFKKYQNVMTTFYNVIKKADSNYTEMECQNFFKSVVKNAKRRFELAENITNGKKRESSGKNRPQNLNYKKKENYKNEADNNGETNEGTESNEVNMEFKVAEEPKEEEIK